MLDMEEPRRNYRVRRTRVLFRVCWEPTSFPAFSPSAFQGLLQTSVFKARNCTTGATVSLIKKSDVKNHLSPRHRSKIHLQEESPASTHPKVNDPLANQLDGVSSSEPQSLPTSEST